MGSLKDVQLSGCLGHHGPYSFYKWVKIDGRVLGLSSFFPVRIFPDSAIFSIAEVQLLWSDRAENFVSLRLYFLPENTPEGRLRHHGEDEVIALQDKVIIRASDLSSWLVEESEWDWGYVLPNSGGGPSTKTEDSSETTTKSTPTKTKGSDSNNCLKRSIPRDKFLKNDKNRDSLESGGSSRVLVVNYQRYVRVRTLVKRLEGSTDLSNWLLDPLVQALGGINVGPDCRLLFSKEVFDYPELEDHELLCNHLAPKLKGRPRKRTRKRDFSGESESNNSTSSATSTYSEARKKSLNGVRLVNPPELEKQQVPCESPKSITSEESHAPDSPPDKTPSGNEENDAPSSNEPDEMPLLTSVECKTEHLSSIEVNSNPKPPKKTKKFPVHQPKKRKAIRQKQISVPPPPRDWREISPEIKLESTRVKVKVTPTLAVNHDKSSILSPETTIPANSNCIKDPEPLRAVTPPPPVMPEPSIGQIPEKMEKSSVLQILPIRPSVITKQTSDTECNGVGPGPLPKKSRAAEHLPSIPSVPPVKEDLVLSERKGSHTTRIDTTSASVSKHIEEMKPTGEADKTMLNMTGPFKSSSIPFSNKGNFMNSDARPFYSGIQPAHLGSVSTPSYNLKSNTREGTDKPALLITTVEMDSKRHNVFPMARISQSPFLPTGSIYGKPSLGLPSPKSSIYRQPRPTAVIPAIRSNGVSVTQAQNDCVLDFSVKRQKLDSYHNTESVTNVGVNGINNGECLDLRVDKSQSNNRKVYHTISEIPPPNAVNQHGLRLTSEVTLFPSQQKQPKPQKRLPPQVHVKRTTFRESNPVVDAKHPFPQTEYPHQGLPKHSRQPHMPTPTKPRPLEFQQSEPLFSRQNVANPKLSGNPYNHSNHISAGWKPPTNSTSVLPSPGIPTNLTPRPNNGREQTFTHTSHSSNQPKYTARSLTTHSPPVDQQRTHMSAHTTGNSSTHSPTVATMSSGDRRYRHPSEISRDRSRQASSDHLEINPPYGNFVLPAPPPAFNYYPHNIDPTYFPQFPTPPFGMSPQSLLRLGAMESIHLAYMQQGLAPHGQAHLLNWGSPARESRNGSQK